MAYTVLVYSYWASFHDAYICLCHAHYRYQPQLPYKSHKTYLTNRMGSTSHHIMPLVTNSLGDGQTDGRTDGHTHTHTHTHKHTHTHTHTRTHIHTHTHTHKAYRNSRTEAILRNQACTDCRPAHAWFKKCNNQFGSV